MKAEEIKLHFQKLNEQKIELALVDDIKKNANEAKSLKEKIESNFSLANGGLRACADFEKNYSSAVSMAKEVGFPIPAELNQLTSLIKSYESFFNKIKAL
jgi:hypothetical protein